MAKDIKDLINAGTTEDGNSADVYQSLETYRQEHPMDVDTVIQLGLDICQILDRGKPHGEINTTGILVTDNWEFVFDEDGEMVDPNPQTDVYALGMLMYRLLNKGRLPFMPPVPQKVTKEEKDEAVHRCLSGEPFPVPADGNPQITQVIQKACHPERSKRYQTAGEMRTALDGIVLSGVRKNVQAQEPAQPQKAAVGQNPDMSQIKPVEANADKVQPVKKTKDKKRKKQSSGDGVSLPSAPSVPKIGIQGLFFLLSAALAIAGMVTQKSMTITSFDAMILYGYCAGQFVLLILALRRQGYLKVLGFVTMLDMLYVILYDILIRALLQRFGVAVPDMYHPGYLAVLLPIAMAVLYWLGRLGGRVHIPRNRIFAVLMLIDSVVMAGLGLLRLNKTVWSLQIYPYLTGALLFLLALLIVESRTSRLGARFFAFLNICAALALVGMRVFDEQIQGFGIPVRKTELILLGVTILIALITCFLAGEKSWFEDDDTPEKRNLTEI